MSWQDRLREGAYTSPSGTRIVFDFEDLSREVDLRGTAFEFPGIDEAYVQRNGFGSRRYPMRCFFSGPDHDLFATAFEAAVLEAGIGKLEHPLYETINVVPFGTLTRRDDLKNAANQSVIEVTFWTTVGALYPSAEVDPRSEILAALGDFNAAAAGQFAASTDLSSALGRAESKATIRSLLTKIGSGLSTISATVTSIDRQFRELQSTINLGLDVLIGQPLLLAEQISNLISLPARALSGIESRLDAYATLAETIFGSPAGRRFESIGSSSSLLVTRQRIAGDFHIADLMATAAVAGAVTAAVANPIAPSGRSVPSSNFQTKPQALSAAEAVLEQFDAVVRWRDAGFRALSSYSALGAYQLDTGEAVQALERAVALGTGLLVQVSFSLRAERRIVLDRPRTIIDLAAELYGRVDDVLDEIVAANDLTGPEILELPRGRSIVYFS